MSDAVTINFATYNAEARGVLVLFTDESLEFGKASLKILGKASETVKRAAAASRFKGKSGTAIDILAPANVAVDRLVIAGTGKRGALKAEDYITIGGATIKRLSANAGPVTIVAEVPDGPIAPKDIASIAAGIRLRSYSFDRYKTKKKDDDLPVKASVTFAVADVAAAKKAFAPSDAVTDGVLIARDLVNEPPNVLYPEEFAKRAARLRKLGVEVQIFDTKAMTKLGMGALLGVAQGSVREGRMAVMRWNGGKKGEKPVAFIGKGVCFDTGGISIKPAGSMEEMKGDMAGAACVVGLMHALAARKAKANVIGAIGLVENMPDGNAQRPGDIVTTMSGQTIEIINTDAEGRLVLADVLWYVAKTYKPKFMIDLATLTGAIMVALGTEHAGLFSNNDELCERLTVAGRATGEHVWRMPLGPAYDKLIDSKFADMKNTGPRWGGSITAAQLLQRFVDGIPWAHLDIAGTGMGAPSSDINTSFGTGYGVRLLDRLVADHYEAGR